MIRAAGRKSVGLAQVLGAWLRLDVVSVVSDRLIN
jgi:hypothetical protein